MVKYKSITQIRGMRAVPRPPREVMECRDYLLPPEFPVIVLTGEEWRISDRRSPVLHFHNHMEIGVCHSDSGVVGFRDRDVPFKAGDVTVIAAGTPHTTCSAPGTASKWSYVMVDPIRLIDPTTSVTEPPVAELYNGVLYNFRAIVTAEQDPLLGMLVNEVVREMTEKRTNYRRSVRALLDTVLNRLSRRAEDGDTDRNEKPFHISPALRYVDQHYMEDIRVDDLAAECKMSTSYFRRVFTETMGLGPLEYLNKTRIIRACTILKMSDSSVLDVCEAVGFRSLSSFNRHFSAIMGQPPTAWRSKVHADMPVTLRKYTGWAVPPKTV